MQVCGTFLAYLTHAAQLIQEGEKKSLKVTQNNRLKPHICKFTFTA